jgi:hypothetical protein
MNMLVEVMLLILMGRKDIDSGFPKLLITSGVHFCEINKCQNMEIDIFGGH